LRDPVVGRIMDGSPAAAVGLQSGDRILSIDGEPIVEWPELVGAIQKHRAQPMPMRIERGGRELELTPRIGEDGTLGILPRTQMVKLPFGAAVSSAFTQTGQVVYGTFAALGQLIQGRGEAQLMGPVGIVSETAEAARSGFESMAKMLVLISLALALVNLLPLPALDGGRLVFIAIAMVRRRPVDAKLEAVVHGVGMLVLLGLVLYVTWGDIGRQIRKARGIEPPPPAAQEQRNGPAQQPPPAEAAPAP
jgi:regulator of sigma E protease